MHIEYRRATFYASVLLFLIFGSGTILYTQGWRVDFENFRITKVGGISVRSFPDSAEISLDGESLKSFTRFFQNGTLITNLLPKTYRVKISSPGYESWEGNVDVLPTIVSQLEHVVLIPKESSIVSPGPIRSFWIINGNILIENERGELLFREKKMSGNTVLEWTDDGKRLLAFDDGSGSFFWNNLENATAIHVTSAIRKLAPSFAGAFSVKIDPTTNSSLLIYSSSSLRLWDPGEGILKEILASPSAQIQALGASRFFIGGVVFDKKKEVSKLFLYDKLLGSPRETSHSIGGRTKKIEWQKNDFLWILQENGELYSYNQKSDLVSKVASDAKDFSLAHNGDKIAVLGNRSLEIFDLEDASDYLRFNLPDRESVRRLEWYGDSRHLFVHYPERIAFLDLGDRGLENLQTIAESRTARYDLSQNEFYFLKENILYRLAFPE